MKILFVLVSILEVVVSLSLLDFACSQEKLRWAPCDNKTPNRTARSEEIVPAAQKGDDPACKKLKKEYDVVCFTPPPAEAFRETKAFCEAFIDSCGDTLKTNLFTNIKSIEVDFRAYCMKNRERFEYVCPEPLRFHSHRDEAVDFCARYKFRCPDATVPNEPIPIKEKNEGHIYIRELASPCAKMRRFARNYCTDLDLLKYPKYFLPCAQYKYFCLDIYQRVIYGG